MFNFWPFNINRKRREALAEIEARRVERFNAVAASASARNAFYRAKNQKPSAPPPRRETASRREFAAPYGGQSSNSAPAPVYDNWPYPAPAAPYASPAPEADSFRAAGGSFDGGGASGDWSSSSSSSSDSGSSSSDSGSSSSGSD